MVNLGANPEKLLPLTQDKSYTPHGIILYDCLGVIRFIKEILNDNKRAFTSRCFKILRMQRVGRRKSFISMITGIPGR